ncbi:HMA2 domain-containing protein [Desulfobacca acetoxidans]|uniref:Heavy metal translocating P-type ATPase n=1 Tax=Desulfobacca acetoxidans (strain ATCC 700848 / DSM 11109 / ASRB2) TaxID=880072 RepID=F2NC19_DESAR|nr:hypothetical protein [Desulfobacca acetoxidans]AEB08096.1 hypothetical protein Desac_0203 [Desulfobacca acetoxidans DSM 11109]
MNIRVVHALPGRVRLKIAPMIRHPVLAREIEDRVKGAPGVTGVECNPVTGSLVILYEPATKMAKDTIRSLTEVFKSISPELTGKQVANLLKPSLPPECPDVSPYAASITQFFGALNAGVSNILGGLDLKVLLPTTLFVLGINRMIAERATPPAWYNLLWFSLATFMLFHPTKTSSLEQASVLHETMEGMATLEMAE